MVALLEFQAKNLLRDAGVGVPVGLLVRYGDEAFDLGGGDWVCKAQVATKNRAAWGGIRFADDSVQAREHVLALLAGDVDGHRAVAVLVEEKVPIVEEWFVSVITDPWGSGMILQVSDAGGSGVENRLTSGDSHHVSFAPTAQPTASKLLVALGWSDGDPVRRRIADLCADLCRIAIERDLLLLEINPLAVTVDGQIVIVDAHVTVDDAAEFRQGWLTGLDADLDQVHRGRAWRRRYGGDFKVVDPDGTVALLNTGAGAGMLVMDELDRHGVRAFDFSDIRAGTLGQRQERFDAAADLICAGEHVRVVLINIHAGITDLRTLRHDLARLIGRFAAASLPTVVRLQGPHAREVSAGLSSLPLVEVESRLDAAIELVVAHTKDAS